MPNRSERLRSSSIEMPFRGSGSVTGAPEIRASELSLRKRKASFGEQYRAPPHQASGINVLLEPLILGQPLHVGNHPESPIDNVRRVLVPHEDTEPPLIVSEMLRLNLLATDGRGHRSRSVDAARWEQHARWIKYEQVVEGDITRFSRPHITLLNVQAILQLRNCLRRGSVLLDVDLQGFQPIAESIVSAWQERAHLAPAVSARLRRILLAPKLHLGAPPGVDVYAKPSERHLSERLSSVEAKNKGNGVDLYEEDSCEEEEEEAAEVLGEAAAAAKRRERAALSLKKIQESNRRLLAKLPSETLAASILIGEAPFLDQPLSAFVRLRHAQSLHPSLPDLPLPSKFLFVLLSPAQNYDGEIVAIGRMMGSLFADDIWRKIALHTTEPFTLADGIDEFFSQTVVIPPGRCDVSTRWQPRTGGAESRRVGMLYAHYEYDSDLDECGEGKEKEKGKDTGTNAAVDHARDIYRTGKLFGGLAQDIRRKLPVYPSEFTDFFRGRFSQALAATMFIFFANITSIITFGAVMERALHHQMAAVEAILCGGLSGVVFALFSGQPLNILSATGPTLVFEKILFDFCISNGWEFLPFRLWVGIWICAYLVVFVATDLSALVGLITRFTEEAFATLISVVFIIQAFQKLLEISHDAPIVPDPREVYHSPCFCHLTSDDGKATITRLSNLTAEECEEQGGEARGLQCHFKPDVYMLSVLLTFGTFATAALLSKFRKSCFFPSWARNTISDFAVLISIIVMTAFSHSIGLDVPVLHVPETFRPTLARSWLVNASATPPSVALLAAVPAAFYTILIVMDQQITAVIVNRKDNKLKKGGGYHLDLLVIALLVLVCAWLGLPFYVAATVLSVMHIDSLRVYSESSAPGEVPQFLGVNEQRLTSLFAHVLIGLSVFLTPIIKLVPLPVLIGVFLYMGVVSLLGQQFVQRIALLFTPDKHQPDYIWLRLVRMNRVHLFTAIQLAAMVALFLVKYTKLISMMFPLMLVFMVLLRMFVLGRIFSRAELLSLDDLVPTIREIMLPSKRDREGRTDILSATETDDQSLMEKNKKNGNGGDAKA